MNSPALAVVPPTTTTVARIMLACLGVYWVSLLTVSGSPGAAADTAIKIMLGAGGVFLVLVAHYHAHGLRDAVRVLGAQRAPATLWRDWLRGWLATVTRYWAAVSIGAAVQLAMPASSTFWLAGPALLSLLLCFASLHAMAQAGLAPPALRRCSPPFWFWRWVEAPAPPWHGSLRCPPPCCWPSPWHGLRWPGPHGGATAASCRPIPP